VASQAPKSHTGFIISCEAMVIFPSAFPTERQKMSTVFAALGVVQAAFLLYHGHNSFYILYWIFSIFSLAAVNTPSFYTVHTGILLMAYATPNTVRVFIQQPFSDGHVASFDVMTVECYRPHLHLQSAVPVEWAVVSGSAKRDATGGTVQIGNATQFSAFRIVVFCENVKRPVASNEFYIDRFTVRQLEGRWYGTGDAAHTKPVQQLGEPVPRENPFYSWQHRDVVVRALWVIFVGRVLWDWKMFEGESIEPVK
jgi:hypothetical protein